MLRETDLSLQSCVTEDPESSEGTGERKRWEQAGQQRMSREGCRTNTDVMKYSQCFAELAFLALSIMIRSADQSLGTCLHNFTDFSHYVLNDGLQT